MADYQVRRWSAWHHHMALSLMAQQFMVEERIRQKDAYPMLSHSDIEYLLRTSLPMRDTSPDGVVRQLEKRHRKRQQVMENTYIKQLIADKVNGFR